MITELAIITALPGAEERLGEAITAGVQHIRRDPGGRSAEGTRCVAEPGRYLLTVRWASLEAHVEGFRGSPGFGRWLDSIKGLFDPATLDARHYVACSETGHRGWGRRRVVHVPAPPSRTRTLRRRLSGC